MKKLVIREGACIGCGACIAVDPTHFDFNDDGLAEVISSESLENNSTINALESCPTNAIIMEDSELTESSCSCEPCSCDNCEGGCQ